MEEEGVGEEEEGEENAIIWRRYMNSNYPRTMKLLVL